MEPFGATAGIPLSSTWLDGPAMGMVIGFNGMGSVDVELHYAIRYLSGFCIARQPRLPGDTEFSFGPWWIFTCRAIYIGRAPYITCYTQHYRLYYIVLGNTSGEVRCQY